MEKEKNVFLKILYASLIIIWLFGFIQITQGNESSFFSLKMFGMLQIYVVIMVLFMKEGKHFLEAFRLEKSHLEDDAKEYLNTKGMASKECKNDNAGKENRIYTTHLVILIIISVLFAAIIIRLFLVVLLERDRRILPFSLTPIIIALVQSIVYLLLNKWYHFNQNRIISKTMGVLLSALRFSSFILLISLAVTMSNIFNSDIISSVIIMIIFLSINISIVAGNYSKLRQRDHEESIVDISFIEEFLSHGRILSNIVDYIEKNTGISMRSLWSIQYLKDKLSMAALLLLILFWGFTALVQINPYEQGIIYRLGTVRSEHILEPGLHVKLPWPIDKVKSYPVSKINYFTVGYESMGTENYLWTKSHHGEEYKLLLGDGKELVSINMQVSYRINDLYKYIINSQAPEEILKAEAYGIIMRETVTTNLDNLLSRDRYTFSDKLLDSLRMVALENKLGLEINSVAIQSIHPPIEIADTYQEVVSAKIKKEVSRNMALSKTKAAIPKADMQSREEVTSAEIERYENRAEAIGETARYIYQKRAYEEDKDFYKWRKWLEAFEASIKGEKMYIIEKDDEIDETSIWMDLRDIWIGG